MWNNYLFVPFCVMVDLFQMFFHFLLWNFQDSAFFLSEEVFDELERVFVEPCSCVFLLFAKFPQILCSSQGFKVLFVTY